MHFFSPLEKMCSVILAEKIISILKAWPTFRAKNCSKPRKCFPESRLKYGENGTRKNEDFFLGLKHFCSKKNSKLKKNSLLRTDSLTRIFLENRLFLAREKNSLNFRRPANFLDENSTKLTKMLSRFAPIIPRNWDPEKRGLFFKLQRFLRKKKFKTKKKQSFKHGFLDPGFLQATPLP